LLEQLVLKNCPKCHSDKRYWHKAGVFLVTNPMAENSSGGMAPSAAVVCPECGYIEFYAQTAEILQQIPEALVATEHDPESTKT
jgi:predicted nucleic-acid-binding Zn-ribbon protein